MVKKASGFTVIELTLVVAITALVALSILVGIGNSLRNQRYIDATNQTLDYFEGLFSLVINSRNDRPSDSTCTSAGGVQYDPTGGGRGTSDCIMLGYFITTNDGKHFVSKRVIAKSDPRNVPNIDKKTELEILQLSGLDLLPEVVDDTILDWDVRLKPASSGIDPPNFDLMIIRIPVTGSVRSYVYVASDASTKSPDFVMNYPIPDAGIKFCIQPEGLFNSAGSPNGFIINKYASTSSSIQRLVDGNCE